MATGQELEGTKPSRTESSRVVPNDSNFDNSSCSIAKSKLLELVGLVLQASRPEEARPTLLGEALEIVRWLSNHETNFAAWIVEEQSSIFSDSHLSWEIFLPWLSRVDAVGPEYACLQSAALTTLRFRHLQARFGVDQEEQKFQLLYNLAYGLSHELNNPLANVATRAGLLMNQIQSSSQQQHLQAILDNAMRGCEMLGDLMLIARPPQAQLTWIDLEQLSEEICHRCTQWCSLRNVHFDSIWIPLGSCKTDKQILLESLWCLVRNAIEASAAGSRIVLSGNVDSSYLILHVEDEGPGLSSHALSCAFDPFYSGREAGRGLGLGLTKAQRFAGILGGKVTIENRTTQGCRATIQIPTAGWEIEK